MATEEVLRSFFPSQWYWIVSGDATRAYFSGGFNNYVPADDPGFLAWLDQGNRPTAINTEANLGSALAAYGLEPIPRGIHKGYAAQIDRMNGKITYSNPISPALDDFTAAKTAAEILGG